MVRASMKNTDVLGNECNTFCNPTRGHSREPFERKSDPIDLPIDRKVNQRRYSLSSFYELRESSKNV